MGERCDHGFELQAIPCPSGCHDARILEALRSSETLRQAADALNWTAVGQFHQRARVNSAIRAEVARRKDTRRRKGQPHPGFVDMTGKTVGAWVVVKRLPNVSGNAVWQCRHACGSYQSIQGITLRSSKNPRCKACRGRA